MPIFPPALQLWLKAVRLRRSRLLGSISAARPPHCMRHSAALAPPPRLHLLGPSASAPPPRLCGPGSAVLRPPLGRRLCPAAGTTCRPDGIGTAGLPDNPGTTLTPRRQDAATATGTLPPLCRREPSSAPPPGKRLCHDASAPSLDWLSPPVRTPPPPRSRDDAFASPPGQRLGGNTSAPPSGLRARNVLPVFF